MRKILIDGAGIMIPSVLSALVTGFYEYYFVGMTIWTVLLSRGIGFVTVIPTARYFANIRDYFIGRFRNVMPVVGRYLSELIATLVSHWFVYAICLLAYWYFDLVTIHGVINGLVLSFTVAFFNGPIFGFCVEFSRNLFDKKQINFFNYWVYDLVERKRI